MLIKNPPLSLAVAASLATHTGAAFAEGTTLDEVVVSASGYEQRVIDAPASVTIIDANMLSQGAHKDVVDVLAHVPGVFATGGGSGKDISIRGLPSQYTLLLVDGRPQSSRESQPNGGGGLDQEWLPPLQSIERIEVVRGPMSTLYGSNAMGGIVNIITKKVSSQWHGSVRVQGVMQESDDFGHRRQGEVYLSGPLIPNTLSLAVGGRYLLQDEDEVARGTPEKDLRNYHAKLNYVVSDEHDVELALLRSTQTRTSRMGHSAAASARSDSETDNEKESFALTHHGKWGDVDETSYFQQETTRNQGRDIHITNRAFDTRWVIPTSEHMTTVGAGLVQATLVDNDTNDLSDLSRIGNDQYSAYAEDEWFVLDTLTLTSGIRVDKNENYDTQLSPRLFANWYLHDNWVLKAGVATGYRAPELRQMTAGWGQESRGGDIYGNADLQPETLLSKEIGLTYHRQGWTASMTLFDNRFDDKIVTTDCPAGVCSDPDARHYTNVDKARTQGVELSTTAQLTATVKASANYTYTRSEQLSGEHRGQPLTQMPLHLFASSVDWQMAPRLGGWLKYEYRGTESQETGLSSNTATRAPAYSLFHLGLQYEASRHIVLQAGIDNLLDEPFEFAEYGFVDSGRAYWASAEYRF